MAGRQDDVVKRMGDVTRGSYSRRGLAKGGLAVGLASAAGTMASRSRAQDAVELTIREHQQPRIDLLEQRLPSREEAMAAQGRNITVSVQQGPAPDSEFLTKLTLDFNSGNAADVMSYSATSTPDFAAAGYLLDLIDRVIAWPDWPGHFYQKLRDEQIPTAR